MDKATHTSVKKRKKNGSTSRKALILQSDFPFDIKEERERQISKYLLRHNNPLLQGTVT